MAPSERQRVVRESDHDRGAVRKRRQMFTTKTVSQAGMQTGRQESNEPDREAGREGGLKGRG